MTGVQRVKEYIDYNTFEDDLYKKDRKNQDPKKINWVTEGKLQVKNIYTRYREGLPLVLDNLSFDVKPGNKVGIIGRTGSGKSTFMLCMMRILELAGKEDQDGERLDTAGSIEIDGQDIKELGLHELRIGLTIIPQDPFLMAGSLRENVDPLEQHSDDEIIQALRTCKLLETMNTEAIINQKIQKHKEEEKKKSLKSKKKYSEENDPELKKLKHKKKVTDLEKLDFELEAKGTNLSIGQRQLVCIARALIKKPNILLMDEATANIDQKTDSIIQGIIKHNLKDSTVITIAHRLVTIIQYDQLVILKDGKKIEEGSPIELIRQGGYFANMIEEGGEEFRKKMVHCAENRDVDPTLV